MMVRQKRTLNTSQQVWACRSEAAATAVWVGHQVIRSLDWTEHIRTTCPINQNQSPSVCFTNTQWAWFTETSCLTPENSTKMSQNILHHHLHHNVQKSWIGTKTWSGLFWAEAGPTVIRTLFVVIICCTAVGPEWSVTVCPVNSGMELVPDQLLFTWVSSEQIVSVVGRADPRLIPSLDFMLPIIHHRTSVSHLI